MQLEEVAHRYAMMQLGEFQFHIGAIRSVLRQSLYSEMLNFNSILVQLEERPDRVGAVSGVHFNSILVQLEEGTAPHRFLPKLISIPYWCN